MAHHDTRLIVERVEEILDEERKTGLDTVAAAERAALARARKAEEQRRSASAKLERGALAQMRSLQAIDKVETGGGLLGPVKAFVGRIMTIFTAKQAAYNTHNVEALQLLAGEVETLAKRVRELEDGPARTLGLAEGGHAEVTRESHLVNYHLAHVSQHVDLIAGNMKGVTESLGQVIDGLNAVSKRIGAIQTQQGTTSTDVAAARLEVSRLWTEVSLAYESIDDRAEGLWKAFRERDDQLLLNTQATQELHTQVGSVEATSRELRARLLVLGEQLALHQEMLEGVKTLPRAASDAQGPKGLEGRQGQGNGGSHFMGGGSAEGAGPDPATQRLLDLAYLRFQRQFRGDEEQLRQRQRAYVDVLAENLPHGLNANSHVLDIACGDGVFLEILRERHIGCEGVDINEAMVKMGRERGLPITQGDAIAYLENVSPQSLDAVTAFQFIEHLPPWVLMKLLRAAFRGLKPGGLILLETINPHTLKALHWFHLDLTHDRLVFPEMLELLCETAGLTPITWKGINVVAPERRLTLPDAATDAETANLHKLNDVLFGAQDYFLVARRPGASA